MEARLIRILTFMLIYSGLVQAAPPIQDCRSELVCAESLAIESTKIRTKRHPYFPNSTEWNYGVALNWDLSLLKRFVYWNNRAYFDTDQQVRHVGWEFETGLRVHTNLDVFAHHHSQHTLESLSPYYAAPENTDGRGSPQQAGYPLDDRYGFRIRIIPGETHRGW